MKMDDSLHPTHRIADRTFDLLAMMLVFVAYFSAFAAVRREASVWELILASLSNLVPLVPLTLAVRASLRRWLIGSSLLRQVLGHCAFAAFFTLGWHWLILIASGIRSGGSFTEFTVRAYFSDPALAWQFLQGITVYAFVASLTYMRAQPSLTNFGETTDDGWPDPEPSLKRYFIKLDDDIQPIDMSTVISIIGADDYAEVTTAEGQHLVRTTLSKFEASLDPEQFLRVHRSRIVNIHKIERAESAGDGRMTLYMENGERVRTSRAGAKALRNLVL